jgi:uncharacterized membrane protein
MTSVAHVRTGQTRPPLLTHWLFLLNLGLALFVAGAFAAPILAATGASTLASSLYDVYHLTCHQWAFRSFFLFGPQAIYSPAQLAAQGLDPFRFIGSPTLGWKMAFCERDLAIYLGLLAVGLWYARQRDRVQPLGFLPYCLLALPMALDGFTQLFGWRESTWELRVTTGLIFGVASAWLILPRLDAAFGFRPTAATYAPENACPPPTPTAASPASPLSTAGR